MLSALTAQAQPPQQGINFKVVSAQELKAEMDAGKRVLVVDARTEQEFAQGHLPGAINISPNKFRFIAGFLPKDKGFPLVFYCRGYS